MASLKIHIDLVNEAHISLIAGMAEQLGWDVYRCASDTKPPDILVTKPERLRHHSYLEERMDLHPQILLLASPEEVDPNDLIGVRILGFLDSGLTPDLIKGELVEAWKKEQNS